ncbi:hypothetical protein STK_18500 [Sulfurisphaera tokodaii str. 7]|uniref:DUF1286 domain-containing protein n=2 Tax=Sulfurisphaera tokodaii TaxID=111955 RepID=Q96ZI4_SULTO|nr:DUF1286 domain-containing protein [Sulfurisphaera tokodaii]BAB66941.1 hypothetical protein STK_18500 [Sulfurisphaera tokodaii str. 7]
MKLRTHYVFSLGVISLVLVFLSNNFFVSFFVAAYSSILGNSLIDKIGHRELLTGRGYIPVRSPLTHTYPRSVLWGLLPTIPLIFLIHYMYGYYALIEVLVSGVIVGPTHMFLDMFTEAGVYVKKRGRWRRFALAHYRYDNPAVNGLAIFAGFLLLLIAYYISNLYYYF